MSVDLEQIDPRNEAALRAWWEVGHAATADRPGKPWPLWEQSRVALPAHNPERGITVLALHPGWVRTDLAPDGKEEPGAAADRLVGHLEAAKGSREVLA